MRKSLCLWIGVLWFLTGCGAAPTSQNKESALAKNTPKSILVLPPTNSSVEVGATTSVLARATAPLAELGYYVFPVALVDEVFRQNGLSDGHEIHAIPRQKLQQIFGADAVMYLDVERYGTEYQLFDSVTTVAVRGKLVDLQTGETLWEGEASANDANRNQTNNLWIQLIAAAITQVVNTTSDKGYRVAAQTMSQLFFLGDQGYGRLIRGHRWVEKANKK